MSGILKESGKLAIAIIEKYKGKGISKRGLARILYEENPTVYSSAEHARKIIQLHTGASGDQNRMALRNSIIQLDSESEKILRKRIEEKESKQYKKAKKRKFNKDKKRFIITWGQCNTPVHKEFYKNIEAYAQFIGADIHIILGRYKNPNSVYYDEKEMWVSEIVKYADANRHDIHKHLSILSDIRIQPTATNPMSGLQGISGSKSCIFGSPKVQMETVPVLEGNKPKVMLTTGACTVMNYTDSKAGKKGEFHHILGFCVVEIKDNEIFFVRQVTAHRKTGSFTDLYYKVSEGKVQKVNSIAAIVLGDLHYGFHDKKVLDSTLSLMKKLVPRNVILHDVFDCNSINHHTIGNAFVQYGKEMNNTNDLGKEVENMMKGLTLFKNYKVAIVTSNHNDALDKWLINQDWKKNPSPKNYKLYMEYSLILLDQHAKDPNNVKGVVAELIKKRFPDFITLGRNDSFKVKGFELSQHGDKGANGSKGNINQFRKISSKIVTADSHSPGRKDGALCVGTTTKLRLEYNAGASNWLHSHVIIHEDSKAQHVNFIEGEFTTFKY